MGATGFGEDKNASRMRLTEQWNLQGRWRWGRWKVSRLGSNDNYLAPDPEQIEKLLALIRQRQRLELTSQAEDTVVVGTADFQPVSFMQEGAARSHAVCRIAREFSLPEFRRFIKEIQHREDLRSFSSIRKLVEIFSIPAEVVKDIFVNIQGLILDNLDKDILVDIQRSLLSNLSDSALSSYAIELRSKSRQALSQKNLDLDNFDQYGSLENLQEAFDKDNAVANVIFRLGYLEALKVIDASILAKLNPLPVGTGFLVGGNHILTNQHVIPDEKVAEQCIAQFNYIQDARGHTQASIDFGLSPRDLFFSNPDLDYTLVQVNTGRFTKQAGYDLGWITMAEDARNITPGWFALDVTNTIPISEIKSRLEQYLKESVELKNKAKKSLGSGDEQQLNRVLAELNQDMRVEIEPIDEGWAIFIDHPFLNQSDLEGLLVRNESNIVSLLVAAQDNLASQSIIRNPITAKKGDVVFIIQHPRGQEQQIVLSDNQVILNGLYRNFLRYRADSDYGSSGSPVFNDKWQLVALHHAAIGDLSLSDVMAYNTSDSLNQPSPTSSTAEASTPQIYAQQGVRICRILEDLKQKSLSDPKLRNFIDDFAVTVEQLNYPPLPAALEFDGVRSFVSVDGEVAVTFAGTRQDGTVDLVEWSKGGVQLSHLSLTAGEVDEGETFGNRVWLSQDGQKIAVAGQKIATQEGDRHPIELRDRTGILLHTLADHPTPVTCACFSPDDRILAIGCKDGSIRVWDCQTGKLLTSLLHTSEILDLTFSPDGKTLVASSPDEALMVCQQTDNQWSQPKKRILEGGHIRYSVSCYNVSSDGKTFVSGDEEGWVKLWNPETGQLRYTLPPHGGKVSQLTFAPDNRYLACVVAPSHEELAVKIWELSDNQRPQLLSEKEDVAQFTFTQVQIGSDSHTVATYLSTAGTITLETLHRSPQLLTKKEDVAQFVFTQVQIGSDSHTVAAYLSKTGIVTLETLQGSLLNQWEGTYDQISISPDGQTLLALTLMEPIWQSNVAEYAGIIAQDPTFGPNPDVWTYTAKLWRLRWENNPLLQVTVNEIAHPLTQQPRIIKTLLSPKSQQVLAMVFDLSGVDQSVPINPHERTWSLKRWNLSGNTKEQILLNGQRTESYPFPGFPKAIGMAFGSNQTDEFFAIAIYDQNASPQSSIHLWTAETTQPVSLPYFENGNADRIVFNLKAKVLIAASQQPGRARLWRLDTTGTAPIVIEPKDVERSYEILVSPTHLLSEGKNLKVKIWEVSQFFSASSPEPREISLWIRDGSYNNNAYSDLPLIPTRLSFNPTGEILGAANSGGGFTTWNCENPSWDLTTNKPSRAFHDLKARNYGYWFRSLQLSPDGDIITTVANNRVRVWTSEGAQLGELQSLSDYSEVAVSPDSHLIVTVDSSHVKICDRSGNVLYKGTSGDLYRYEGTEIAITPDSQVIAIAGKKTIKCWDRRGKELYQQTYDQWGFEEETYFSFYFVPTLTADFSAPPFMAIRVAGYSSATQIFLYEWIVRGKDVQVAPLLVNPIAGEGAMCLSHDGTKLVTGSCSNEFNDEDSTFKVTATFRVWDIKTGQRQVTSPIIPVQAEKFEGPGGWGFVHRINFSPDDEIIFYTIGFGAGEGSSVHSPVVYLWRWKEPDTSPISLKHSHRNEERVWDFFRFDFSPDQQHLITIDRTVVEVWNRKTGWDNLVEGLRERIGYPQFMPDGKSILFIEGTSVKRWNLEHGQSQVVATHSDTITHLAINKNGTIIATASADSTVKLWDSKGNLKKTFSDLHLANALSFFSDNTVFTSGKEGAIKVWAKAKAGDTDSYAVNAKRQCHDAEVLAMAVNESAMMLASAGQEGVVKFWRVNPAKVDQPAQISLLKLPPMQLPPSQQGYAGGYLKVNPAHQQLNTLTDIYSFGGDRPFSIEAWVNPYPDGFGGTVIGKWREDNEGEYRLAVTAQRKVLFSRLAPESFPQAYILESILPIPFGQFHHLAATYDGKEMRLYINGQLDQYTFILLEKGTFNKDESQPPKTYFQTNNNQIFQLIEPTSENGFKLQLYSGVIEATKKLDKDGNVEKDRNDKDIEEKTFKRGILLYSFDVEVSELNSLSATTESITYRLVNNPIFEAENGLTFSVEKAVFQDNHLVLWTNGLIAGKQRTDPFTPTLIGAHFSDPAQVASAEQVTTGFFKGVIAEIRIWDQAIAVDQIRRNQYRRLNPADNSNLIGYWRFEEGMGDRITNLALATKKGIIQNTQWLNTSGVAGRSLPGALMFNGKDAYVYCGIIPPKSQEKAPVPVTPAVTIEAWVNPIPGAGGTIVSRWQENSQGDYLLSITPDGQPQFARLSNSRQIVQWQSSRPISFRQFYHLAASYDGETTRFYVDGELVDSKLSRQPLILFLTLLEKTDRKIDDFDQPYLITQDKQLFQVEYPSSGNGSMLTLQQGTIEPIWEGKERFKAEEEIFSYEVTRRESDLSPEGNKIITFWLKPEQLFKAWTGETLIAEKVVQQDNRLVLWTTDQQAFLLYNDASLVDEDSGLPYVDGFGKPYITVRSAPCYQLEELQSGDILTVKLHRGILQTFGYPVQKTRFKAESEVFSFEISDVDRTEERTVFRLRENQTFQGWGIADAMLLQEAGNLILTASYPGNSTILTNATSETDSFGQIYLRDSSRSLLYFQLKETTIDNHSRITLRRGSFEYVRPDSFTPNKELFSFVVERQELRTSVGGVDTVTYWLSNNQTFQNKSGQEFVVKKVVQEGNQLTLWIADRLIGSGSINASIPVVIGAHLADRAQAESSNAMTGFFNGAIAEVKIWNQALSEDEIRANQNQQIDNPQDNPHLIGYWRFEEGVGDRITNLANPTANVMPVPSYGKGLNIKRLNASQFPTLPLPFSLKFDGESAYVDCADVPQLTEAITVEAWVKHSYGDGLIVHRGGGWNESGYSLYWYRGKIRVELQDTDRKTRLTLDTQENAPSDNTWHHIAFAWTEYLLDEEGNPKRGKNGQPKEIQEVEVYIDGRRQNVIAVTGESKSILSGGLYKSVGIFKGSIGKQSVPLTIGGMTVEQAQDKQKDLTYFDGAIAEVRLWKVARTQNEIKATMYRRLNPVEERNLVGYWRLDEEVKQASTNPSVNFVVRDLTSNQHHGKVYGASWFPSADAITSSPAQSSALPLPEPEPDSEPDSELEKAPDPAPSPAPDSESGQGSGEEQKQEQEQELSPAFKDISTHWAETRILELVGRDIVKGYPDRTFRPDTPMKRAEFAALLVKTFNPTPDSFTVDFIDVPTDFWAHSAIQQVCSSELMIGISGNQFVPNASLTRLQAIIILVVCLLRQEKPLPIPNFSTVRRSNSGIFNDIEDLRDEAHIAIAIAVELKIIAKPSHKQLLPHYRVTRAQVAAMLSRVLQFLES